MSRSHSRIVSRLLALRRAALERAQEMPHSAEEIGPEHPLAKTFGLDRARALLAGESDPRLLQARHRIAEVERLSREGKLVREIAAELGLSYNYVVSLRAKLGMGRRR